ncbi:hypothetical protein Cch01nite_26960 [Cellulomonas chitinilytica]|uniref:Ricin B lectin domain-containing protein n=1 Tax=Cellulomonas chitinilytica TaxID=398759 RepID=A0A919P297_9CELL|nr:RICIN domain-containing protein [Cellulomonas chitinilytica]GIG21972.1 hypothetical protein Cch01nite_26960 [Cellulomonas chitinilytica]
MKTLHGSLLRSLLAVVVALAGLTVPVAVTASSAQAASICSAKFGSDWNVGDQAHWWGAAAAGRAAEHRMVIDIKGPSTADGTQAHIWHWYDGDSQKWCLHKKTWADGSVSYLWRNYYSGKCLRAWGATANGTLVKQKTCSTSDTYQLWDQDYLGTVKTPGGTADGYQWRLVNTNQCLDVQGQGTTDGVLLQLWGCKGGGNQAFY